MLLAGSILGRAAPSAYAQSLPFKPPSTVPTVVAVQFDERAAAVIDFNACSREDDYLAIRTEMAGGDFSSEGENLAHILLAKVAYIRGHSLTHSPIACRGVIFRPRARKDDGSFAHASYEEFEKADRLARAAGPTACAEETAQVKQGAPEGTLVSLQVSTECMARQINEAILAMRKDTVLGSSDVPCVDNLSVKSKGEFDVVDRELMRILYLGAPIGQRDGGILAPTTVDHMYKQLLAARGALSDDTYSVETGCHEPAGDELGSPEDTADRHAWYREVASFLGDLFEWLAKTYVEYSLLSGVGGLAVMPFLLLTDAADSLPGDIRIPETENHRLNIETSRYLTNADLIARLEFENYDRVADIRHDQAGVHDWLLHRLQDIAAHDFQEYNARPYSRYSLNAVLNLYDFAAVKGDPVLADAARIVLDLSEAKFAATSNRGRRVVPFRRRSGEDGDATRYLYESVSAADHEVPRAMLLYGQTQLLNPRRGGDDPRGGRDVVAATLSEMVNAATSRYRPPFPVLATAVDRKVFQQRVRHTGVELVSQSPAFTISAGGVPTGPTASVTVLELNDDTDLGVAMPTVIMPTLAGDSMSGLYRFDGIGVHHERGANTCVAQGFACGLEPHLSDAFGKCTESSGAAPDTLFFVNSAVCFPESPGPHFFLAARIADCTDTFCSAGLHWGVMDIVEARTPPHGGFQDGQPDPLFVAFRNQRAEALRAANPDAEGHATYRSAAQQKVDFSLFLHRLSPLSTVSLPAGQAEIRAIDGVEPPGVVSGEWVTASTSDGAGFDADGKGGATLKGVGGPIVIDFSNWFDPRRTP